MGTIFSIVNPGRKVKVQKWNGKEYEPDFIGEFVTWGIQGEYSDCASLVYSSMIVMDDQLKLHNVPIENIHLMRD